MCRSRWKSIALAIAAAEPRASRVSSSSPASSKPGGPCATLSTPYSRGPSSIGACISPARAPAAATASAPTCASPGPLSASAAGGWSIATVRSSPARASWRVRTAWVAPVVLGGVLHHAPVDVGQLQRARHRLAGPLQEHLVAGPARLGSQAGRPARAPSPRGRPPPPRSACRPRRSGSRGSSDATTSSPSARPLSARSGHAITEARRQARQTLAGVLRTEASTSPARRTGRRLPHVEPRQEERPVAPERGVHQVAPALPPARAAAERLAELLVGEPAGEAPCARHDRDRRPPGAARARAR